jgi:hypothetical protein
VVATVGVPDQSGGDERGARGQQAGPLGWAREVHACSVSWACWVCAGSFGWACQEWVLVSSGDGPLVHRLK